MSIRTRLTLWYSAILAVVLLLFGAAVYAVMSYTLQQSVDSNLQEAAAAIQRQSTEVVLRQGRQLELPRIDESIASIAFVQVTNGAGELQASNLDDQAELARRLAANRGLLDAETLDSIVKQPADAKQPAFTTVRHDGVPPLRVYTFPLVGGRTGDLFGYLQIAQPVADIERAKRGLLFTLLLVGTIGLVVSAAAGVAMAQRALAPVDSITRTVVDIYRADDLEQRVQFAATDEVGRLAGAFNEMLERLELLFRAQQRLVADVSHELRTPLTVIRGNVDLMRAIGTGDPESLDAITRETERMTRMVGNLLLLSQADVGALPMRVQPLDLYGIVTDIERSANIMASGRVSVEASACGDLIVQGDPDRIKQVLLNLVDNALKHTPDGGTVTIAADCVDGQRVKLSVSDTGVGIPEKDLPHVFDRFYRVDKSRSRDMGGAGLGLAIVKSIVDAHGGRLEVLSKLGAGTTFVVWLPAYQPDVL